jgi:Uma2 family endonuclease
MEKYIYDINDLDLNKTYSYADYVLWKFKERVELIKGKIFEMSPAPNLNHQRVSLKLTNVLFSTLENKNCNLFVAPIDVALLNRQKSSPEKEIFTIVQPDLCIICDLKKIADGKKCVGAPDLIIEILSPGNSQKEMNLKFNLYEEAGVLEYWLVYPDMKSINIFVLENGKYIGLKPYSEEEILKSPLFPELEVDVNRIFN